MANKKLTRHPSELPAAGVPLDHLWTMIVSTVRYALGRRSYIVAETADIVRTYFPLFTVAQVEQLTKEIKEALKLAEGRGEHLGMAMDHDTWTSLVKDLQPIQRTPTGTILVTAPPKLVPIPRADQEAETQTGKGAKTVIPRGDD